MKALLLLVPFVMGACEIKQVCVSTGNCKQIQLCDDPFDVPAIDLPPVPQVPKVDIPDFTFDSDHQDQDGLYYR